MVLGHTMFNFGYVVANVTNVKSKKKGVIDFQITVPLNGTEKRVSHISSSGRRSYYLCDGFRESHNHNVNNN